MAVVFFDQRLGAAHYKRWSKYAFTVFTACHRVLLFPVSEKYYIPIFKALAEALVWKEGRMNISRQISFLTDNEYAFKELQWKSE